MGKLIIVTAPSGAGKTTIVRHLLGQHEGLAFSVSATTRPKRNQEEEGKDYYFMNVEEFRALIENGAFVEWEEVYENQFYGTLKSEVERIWASGNHIVFDIDVKGALNLKKVYPERTLTIFIKPPRPEILSERLRLRRSESESNLQKRIEKANYELAFEKFFDIVLVNDDLETAFQDADWIVKRYVFDQSTQNESTNDKLITWKR